MIPRQQILRYHAHVLPVFWPVLWLNLVRLAATMYLAGEEGRNAILIKVSWTGRIEILYIADSEAERRARCLLGEDFDRAPWERLCPADLGVLAALFAARPRLAPQPLGPALIGRRPCLHHALAPP